MVGFSHPYTEVLLGSWAITQNVFTAGKMVAVTDLSEMTQGFVFWSPIGDAVFGVCQAFTG